MGNVFENRYVPKKYERVEAEYKQGDILHNLNGQDYKVVEFYTKDCLLLLSLNTGEFIVAEGVGSFKRYPENEMPNRENTEEGIEWCSAIYLSATPSEIDFQALRRQYEEVPEVEHDTEYQIEIREILSRVKNIKADSLAEAIDIATEMYKNSEIVLDERDYKGVDYLPVEKNRGV